jgi:hypothetical protein
MSDLYALDWGPSLYLLLLGSALTEVGLFPFDYRGQSEMEFSSPKAGEGQVLATPLWGNT